MFVSVSNTDLADAVDTTLQRMDGIQEVIDWEEGMECEVYSNSGLVL